MTKKSIYHVVFIKKQILEVKVDVRFRLNMKLYDASQTIFVPAQGAFDRVTAFGKQYSSGKDNIIFECVLFESLLYEFTRSKIMLSMERSFDKILPNAFTLGLLRNDLAIWGILWHENGLNKTMPIKMVTLK